MTDKQPEALELADMLDAAGLPRGGAILRTQHAAIERKDALLSKCMKHVASNISMTSDGAEAEDLYDAIQQELSKQ